MTAILYDGNGIWADSYSALGGSIRIPGYHLKIANRNGAIWAISGFLYPAASVGQWASARRGGPACDQPVDRFETGGDERGWGMIELREGGDAYLWSSSCPWPSRIGGPFALGSGGDFALGALLGGASGLVAMSVAHSCSNSVSPPFFNAQRGNSGGFELELLDRDGSLIDAGPWLREFHGASRG